MRKGLGGNVEDDKGNKMVMEGGVGVLKLKSQYTTTFRVLVNE